MVDHGQEVLIKDTLVFLVAAGLIVPILRWFRLPAVVGFILAGVALGPFGVGQLASQWDVLNFFTLSDPAAAAPFAELGVLFLLFLLGLEFSVEKLWALRRVVLGAGLAQALISAAVIASVARMLGLSTEAAIIVGLALSLSSTAIVMQLLIDNHAAAGPVGRTALGVLLLQDILVAPILIFVGFAGAQGDGDLFEILIEALVQGFIALVVIVAVGRYLLRHLFRLAAAAGGRDFLMAITLLTVVGAAVITASAGLSIALGAFLAGLLLGETEFKHQAEVDLEPFKGLLLGLFFMTVGLGLDLGVILSAWPTVLAGLVALLGAKFAIAWLAARLFAGGTKLSLEAAGLLAPAGEFAFVILAAGVAAGVVTGADATIASALAGLSMLIIPAMWKVSQKVAERLPETDEGHRLPSDYTNLEGHVVIAGFGRVGRAVATIMEDEQAELVALDRNPERVSRERSRGRKVYLGDGGREEILVKAGLSGAALVIVTLDDAISAERMVRGARRLRPDVYILARAKDVEHARELYAAGANHVIPDAIEAGLQMSARALEQFGYATETVRDLIAAERDAEYERATKPDPSTTRSKVVNPSS
ncbi:MAG: cation:proton antiporter [Pseudomonadota bacterium]